MRIRAIGWTILGCILLASLTFSRSFFAGAQGDLTPKTATPLPSPVNNGGSATWTVNATTFKSNYPKGFEFDIDATSSGGKIASAGVIWRHSPQATRNRRVAKVDPDTGKVSATWQATTSDGVPQWVGVEYWWLLTDTAGNSYETPHQYDVYADNTHDWHHAESEDIVIYWEVGVPENIG